MEEQQQSSDTSGPSTNTTPAAPMKFNRRQRRAMLAVDRKQKSKAEAVSKRRLANFNHLMAWKEGAIANSKLSADQVESVFRVGLNKLFKKDFAERGEFESKLKAIVKNVKKGFKYKSDVAPTPATQDPSAASDQL